MKNPATDKVSITLPAHGSESIVLLFGYGVLFEAMCGMSVKDFLSTRLGLDNEYIENSIGTVLHDGKPIDDIEGWKILQPCAIALSAALPGLFGAAFRMQGKLAVLRPRCAPTDDPAFQAEGRPVPVILKLFNVTAKELGPKLLEKGVLIPTETFLFFWKTILKLDNDIGDILLNGERIDPQLLTGSIRMENIFLEARLKSH